MRRMALATGGLAAMLLLATGCPPRPAVDGASVVRGSALGALPKTSVALLVVEVRRLRELKSVAEWMTSAAAAAEREGVLKTVQDRFGEATLRRLERMGLAIVPVSDGRLAYAIVAEGAFDQSELRRALGDEEVVTLVEETDRPGLSATILAGGSLAFGPREILDTVRSNAARRGDGLDAGGALLALLATVHPGPQVWGAMDFQAIGELARRSPEAAGLQRSLEGSPLSKTVRGLVLEGTLGSDVDLKLLGRAGGAEDAKMLVDGVRGLLAFGRMTVDSETQSEWKALLDSIEVEQQGTDVALRATLSGRTLSAMTEGARAMPPGIPGLGAAPAAPPPPAPRLQ